MSQIETLGILEEIQALVSDKLQVVSYKWLSRNFLVSSNVAKRLLSEFVEKHGSGLEVVYCLSGWLKNTPSNYHIQLVSGPKLAEAKLEYDDNCRVQVYSVQASIPKDPAALWNSEFIQAEELFKQPNTVDNCLRDNRFCGISTSFVKRSLGGTPVRVVAAEPNTSAISGLSKHNSSRNNAALSTEQNKVQQSSSEVAQQSAGFIKDAKSDNTGKVVLDQASKPCADKENISNKRRGQNDKSSSGNGGSLANLWGRASTKPKASPVSADNSDSIPKCNVSSDAQIGAREAGEDENSDDDAQDVNFRRASNGEGNRKRRVVFDFSDEDECEDAVNLASPDPPKKKPFLDLEQSSKTLVSKIPNLIEEKPKKDEVKVKEEITPNIESNKSLAEETSIVSKSSNGRHSSKIKFENQLPETDASKKDKVTDVAPTSPKRRKVIKTRIDDRGREVTEVVWEGEETEVKKVEIDVPKKVGSGAANADSSSVMNNNRPAAAKKSPAVGNTAAANPAGKAGNKKAGNAKDPKQGNILSFFKRV